MKVHQNNTYDIIVVGTGPGGATVAREMARQNKKILLLEWGNSAPVKGSKIQALSMISVPGKSLMITNEMIGVVRGITVGGSSVFYYATAFEPPADFFRSYGIYITDEIKETQKELSIQPLSDSLVGPMAKRIMESAQDLGYKWRKLPKFIDQNRCRSQIMVKAKDSLGGRLGKMGGIRKKQKEADRQKLLRGYRHASAILKNVGAKDIYKSWYVGAHPGGTVKINEIVDNNLKTEFDGLYVCDCSVIPESWGLPPTLTLIALGKRLSKHLIGENR